VILAAGTMFFVCIATEIVSISVSVANLLILPVAYCFYFRSAPILLSEVDNVDTVGSGPGVP